ncbi:MAG: tetratricopeptide repeat protein, partial [Planctomycetota bacterium]
GWWPSHPAEPINGVMVSDFYHKAPKKPTDPFQLMKGSIHPESLEPVLEKMRVHPNQVNAEHVLSFVPQAGRVDQDKDQRLSMFIRTLAETVSMHRAGETLLQTQEWDFAAIYYDSIDHFSHGFMKYHPPKQEHVNQDDFEIYSPIINAAYAYHDVMLSKLLAAAGDDVTVVLMSDHGFHSDHLRPRSIPTEPAGPAVEHRNLGIFVASGAGIKKDHVISGANLLNIAPTILSMFNLPYGDDMDGAPLFDIFEEGKEFSTIPSWEEVEGEDGQHPQGMEMDTSQAKETLEQLIALGYIERPSDDADEAVANCQRELDYNLARAYMDANRYGDAIPLLVRLYNDYPLEFRFGLQLANCLQSMNRITELEELVNDLNNRWRVARLAARAKLKEIAGMSKERRQQFRELKKIDLENEEKGEEVPKLAQYDMRGKPLLFSPEESALIRKVRAVSRGNPHVLDFLSATISASKGDFEAAIDYMKKAEETQHLDANFHFQLGNYYLGLNRTKEAKRCYLRALEIDDLLPGGLMGMCRCYTHTGEYKKAIDFGNQAVALKFHFPLAQYYLGLAHYNSSDFESAVTVLNRAIEQNPNFAEAHLQLAEIYKKNLVDEKKANHHSEQALGIESESTEYLEQSDRIQLKPVESTEFESLLPKFNSDDTGDFHRCLGQPQPVTSYLKKANEADQDEIVIVSGLPRSGTSMMMQMLHAGGLEPYIDDVRKPDESNPRGYYELAKVKNLAFENSWIQSCGGKVLKVVAPLVTYLPQSLNYKMILMIRDIDEIVNSQTAMLDALNRTGGNMTHDQFKQIFIGQLNSFRSLMRINQIPYCEVSYKSAIENPETAAKSLSSFLDQDLDLNAMKTAVDPKLYRQRGHSD